MEGRRVGRRFCIRLALCFRPLTVDPWKPRPRTTPIGCDPPLSDHPIEVFGTGGAFPSAQLGSQPSSRLTHGGRDTLSAVGVSTSEAVAAVPVHEPREKVGRSLSLGGPVTDLFVTWLRRERAGRERQ